MGMSKIRKENKLKIRKENKLPTDKSVGVHEVPTNSLFIRILTNIM